MPGLDFPATHPDFFGAPMSQFNAPPAMPGSMMRPHRGTIILVLGILGLVACFVCGIFAWIMGNADMKAMDAGEMDPTGRGITQAGRIIGMVATILGGLAFCGMLLWIVFAVILVGAGAAGAAGSQP
jgi:hypothetical protein